MSIICILVCIFDMCVSRKNSWVLFYRAEGSLRNRRKIDIVVWIEYGLGRTRVNKYQRPEISKMDLLLTRRVGRGGDPQDTKCVIYEHLRSNQAKSGYILSSNFHSYAWLWAQRCWADAYCLFYPIYSINIAAHAYKIFISWIRMRMIHFSLLNCVFFSKEKQQGQSTVVIK